MIRQWIQTSPFETLEQIVDRALTKANVTGVPILFVFQDAQYEASPAPPGMGTVQMLAERWEKTTPDSRKIQCEQVIAESSKRQPLDWDIELIASLAEIESSVQMLVAGEGRNWLDGIAKDLSTELRPADIQRARRGLIELKNGTRIEFHTLDTPQRFYGRGWLCSFMEERQKAMGGNYNEFPWVDRGRSSWEAKKEEQRQANKKKAAAEKAQLSGVSTMSMSEISDLTIKYYGRKIAEEANPLFMIMESTAEGLNASPGAINLQKLQQAYGQVTTGNETPGMVFWSGPVTENLPTWPGISRSENPEQEVLRLRNLLLTVDSVLGMHLREQLRAAPSSGSVYASGPGYAVTAFELRKVVQALDSVSGLPSQSEWQKAMASYQWGMDPGTPSDFTAESDDGEKIVLSKDGDRFDSGVLFDPSNRPIRKFKLKELAA